MSSEGEGGEPPRDDIWDLPRPGPLVAGHELYDHPEHTSTPHHMHPHVVERGTGALIPGTATFLTRINTGDLRVQHDDIWIVTYPKAGTTWTYEIVLQLLCDADPDKVAQLTDRYVKHRMKRLELSMYEEEVNLELMNSCPPPRVFGTHLPEHHMPEDVKKRCKVVVTMRNPKDCCVSYYHFHRMSRTLGWYKGTFSHFYRAFVNGKVSYGSWFDHTINTWQNHKHDDNYLFLKFEGMKKYPERAVRQIATHLGITLSESVLERVLAATNFTALRDSLAPTMSAITSFDQNISPFMRKGEVGDWKNYFTVAESEHLDQVYKERMRDVPDLTFAFQ